MATTHVTGAIDVVGERGAAAQDLDPAASSQRRRVMVEGEVTEVTFSPATQSPRYRAVLHVQGRSGLRAGLGDSYVALLWHGQRSVPGIMAGTRLRCVAVVSFTDSVPTMYNPRYEIITPKRINR
ncbi:OB-fold nucleic acid binding domain-containing protein [Kocuria sp. cx-116]|uniref:OB-fold nucleic acid binding domain-containing protein n=1 Tax=Kocuria sp. cx-116 TaxID=2771378 RepID=UPI001685ABC8|nr:OB-fold nucleic acid binding domain-containing protein [Kocuria sp. cx-116]MBD2761560.1 OB-fold nucleic acid binding domain-containing protein [Kocuria sp. cx-116]